MMDFLQSVICFFTGHPVEETGIGSIIIYQVKCMACNGLFAASKSGEHRGTLLPWDDEFQNFIEGMNSDIATLVKRQSEIRRNP